MNPDKRRTIESFFLSTTKKPRNNEGQTESNVIISSSLSSTESENVISPVSASSCSGDQTTCDLVSDTSSSSLTTLVSLNESFEAKSAPNDISTSCIDPPVQPKLTTYPLNHQKRSFQSSWYIDRDSGWRFNNWKKALQKDTGLIKHALSQSHIIATKNYLSYKQREETDSSVIKKLDSGRAIQIRKNRDRLVKICSTLHFSASQMISFRGHQENKQYVNSIYF
ncbi:unnamed protein product [Rotaria sp. Silwood1]|nr:unnamed protein product [Rotaria sp. Silwood1]